MAARARACLIPRTGTVRGRTQTWIQVEPPQAHGEDLARDGVPFHPSGSFAPRGGGSPVGTRAAWLREILARTPLSTWTDLFGLPPMEIVCLPFGGAAGAPGAVPSARARVGLGRAGRPHRVGEGRARPARHRLGAGAA